MILNENSLIAYQGGLRYYLSALLLLLKWNRDSIYLFSIFREVFAVVYLTTVLVVMVNGIPPPPRIVPYEDERKVPSNSTFEIECLGDRPIFWKLPSLTVLLRNRFYFKNLPIIFIVNMSKYYLFILCYNKVFGGDKRFREKILPTVPSQHN